MKKFVLIITMLVILILSISFGLRVELVNINFQEDIYKLIPSEDYIIHDFKVLPQNKLVIFWQDKSEKNLNKNFVIIIDAKTKKVIKNTPTEIVRYKESIVDNEGNVYILSWKPVDLYFFDSKNLKIYKAYDNSFTENKEKLIFTLDSKFMKSVNGEILATMDLKKEKEFVEDVVISKIQYENGSLKIIPYFSIHSISKIFDKQPYFLMINYPSKIFVNLIKSGKLYEISTSQEYIRKPVISNMLNELNTNVKNLFDVNNTYLLLSIQESNKNKLTLLNYKEKEKIHIEKEKFIQAKFLSENEVIFSSLENREIIFYVFNIPSRSISELPLKQIKSTNIGIVNQDTFFSFSRNNIYIVNIKR